jgi:hypothetical protein
MWSALLVCSLFSPSIRFVLAEFCITFSSVFSAGTQYNTVSPEGVVVNMELHPEEVLHPIKNPQQGSFINN